MRRGSPAFLCLQSYIADIETAFPGAFDDDPRECFNFLYAA
ncbi:MAG: hypothetical protein ACI9W2_005221, partial [Gammaproteobacteria bacterium]